MSEGRVDSLVGRSDELERLLRAAEDVSEKKAAASIVILGEPGMGKTCLVERFVEQLGRDVSAGSIRRTRAFRGGAVPYGLIRDLSGLEPEAVHKLAAGMGHLSGEGSDPDDRLGNSDLCTAVADRMRPAKKDSLTLVVVDDVQWADATSLAVLPRIQYLLAGAPILWVYAFADADEIAAPALRRFRSELRSLGNCSEVVLKPLSREACRELLTSKLGAEPSDAVERLVWEKTGGLPFFVSELGTCLASAACRERMEQGKAGDEDALPEIPDSIRDLVSTRMESLDDAARECLAAAAVLGDRFRLEHVAGLVDHPEGIDELLRAGLIEERNRGGATFRHALIRDLYLREVPWTQRRNLFSKAADLLEAENADKARIAEMRIAAGETESACDALLAAAQDACDLFAFWDAAELGRRALELWPAQKGIEARRELLVQFARCARRCGQLESAQSALEEWIELAGQGVESEQLAVVQRQLGVLHELRMRWSDAIAARREAVRLFEEAESFVEGAQEALSAADLVTGLIRNREAHAFLEQAERLATAAEREDLRARAMSKRALILAMLGRRDIADVVAQQALTLALEHATPEVASEIYMRIGNIRDYHSDYRGAVDAYRFAQGYCRRHGDAEGSQACLGCLAWASFRKGDWSEARATASQLLKSDASDDLFSRCTAHAVVGTIQAHQGEHRGALDHLDEAIALARRIPLQVMLLTCIAMRAVVSEQLGRFREAADHYNALFEQWQESEERHDVLTPLCFAAEFYAARKRRADLGRCTDALATIAEETGGSEALAAVAFVLGLTLEVRGASGEAVQQYQRALRTWTELALPLELALGERALGRVLLASGRQAEGRDFLQQAQKRSRELGMRPFAAAVSELLGKSSGAHASGSEAGEADRDTSGLTRRQCEVARLIGDGLTNKEIADRLSLSPRTVEMHVANILERLDCRSRGEAVKRAIELGIIG